MFARVSDHGRQVNKKEERIIGCVGIRNVPFSLTNLASAWNAVPAPIRKIPPGKSHGST